MSEEHNDLKPLNWLLNNNISDILQNDSSNEGGGDGDPEGEGGGGENSKGVNGMTPDRGKGPGGKGATSQGKGKVNGNKYKTSLPYILKNCERLIQEYSNQPKKPPFSYATLILLSLHLNPTTKMSLSNIYNWIKSTFVYYANLKSSTAWKNSIRHNLSLNKCFVKVPRNKLYDSNGKGGFWTLDEFLKCKIISGESNFYKLLRNKRKKKKSTGAGRNGLRNNSNAKTNGSKNQSNNVNETSAAATEFSDLLSLGGQHDLSEKGKGTSNNLENDLIQNHHESGQPGCGDMSSGSYGILDPHVQPYLGPADEYIMNEIIINEDGFEINNINYFDTSNSDGSGGGSQGHNLGQSQLGSEVQEESSERMDLDPNGDKMTQNSQLINGFSPSDGQGCSLTLMGQSQSQLMEEEPPRLVLHTGETPLQHDGQGQGSPVPTPLVPITTTPTSNGHEDDLGSKEEPKILSGLEALHPHLNDINNIFIFEYTPTENEMTDLNNMEFIPYIGLESGQEILEILQVNNLINCQSADGSTRIGQMMGTPSHQLLTSTPTMIPHLENETQRPPENLQFCE